MENVLTALVLGFLLIFGFLTLTEVMITTQDDLSTNLVALQDRLDDQHATQISPVDAHLATDKSVALLTFTNTGTTRLADFDQWDVIVEYYDDQDPAGYHINWLPYTDGIPVGQEWTVFTLYLDYAAEQDEVYEPNILNPGESVTIMVRLNQPLGLGQTLRVSLMTPNGAASSTFYTRNYPPELLTNAGLTTVSGSTITLTPAMLAATDTDGPAADLVYTITTPPTQGALAPAESFTQGDLDAGRVSYTHTANGDDTFTFSIADDEDSIGDFDFLVTITNADPLLTTNTGIAVAVSETVIIDSAALSVTDADDDPSGLIYTISTSPTQGMLSLTPTFTQQDILDGRLTYTRTGAGNDSFTFTVTDGTATVGPYIFGITNP